jgi:hypothetical protein
MSPCIQLGASLVSLTVDGTKAIYPTPDVDVATAVDIAFGSDGNPWLLELRLTPPGYDYEGALARKTAAGTFVTYPVHGEPGWMVRDSVGNIWVGQSSGNQITKITIPPDLVFSDGLDAL